MRELNSCHADESEQMNLSVSALFEPSDTDDVRDFNLIFYFLTRGIRNHHKAITAHRKDCNSKQKFHTTSIKNLKIHEEEMGRNV